jgi:hypothetical protein
MTDLRVPERYLNDRRVMRLTPIDFTSFVMASLWSVSNRTDGQVEPDDLPLIPMFNDASIRILVEKGLWIDTSDGWEISDYATTQTSKHDLEVLENARRADREKKARQRAEKRAADTSPGPTFSPDPRDSPRDMSPGGHRTGQAGKDEGNWHVNNATGEADERDSASVPAASLTWDVAPIPNGRTCPVCFDSLPADYPLAVCVKQDDEHIRARAASRVA